MHQLFFVMTEFYFQMYFSLQAASRRSLYCPILIYNIALLLQLFFQVGSVNSVFPLNLC